VSSLGTSATVFLIVAAPDGCGVVGGMRIGRGNRENLLPQCHFSQITYDLTWDQTWATSVETRQLIASAVARHLLVYTASRHRGEQSTNRHRLSDLPQFARVKCIRTARKRNTLNSSYVELDINIS
jgi:hypothetical protein